MLLVGGASGWLLRGTPASELAKTVSRISELAESQCERANRRCASATAGSDAASILVCQIAGLATFGERDESTCKKINKLLDDANKGNRPTADEDEEETAEDADVVQQEPGQRFPITLTYLKGEWISTYARGRRFSVKGAIYNGSAEVFDKIACFGMMTISFGDGHPSIETPSRDLCPWLRQLDPVSASDFRDEGIEIEAKWLHYEIARIDLTMWLVARTAFGKKFKTTATVLSLPPVASRVSAELMTRGLLVEHADVPKDALIGTVKFGDGVDRYLREHQLTSIWIEAYRDTKNMKRGPQDTAPLATRTQPLQFQVIPSSGVGGELFLVARARGSDSDDGAPSSLPVKAKPGGPPVELVLEMQR